MAVGTQILCQYHGLLRWFVLAELGRAGKLDARLGVVDDALDGPTERRLQCISSVLGSLKDGCWFGILSVGTCSVGLIDGPLLDIGAVRLCHVGAVVLGPHDMGIQKELRGCFLGPGKLLSLETTFGLALELAGDGRGWFSW